MFHDEVSMQLKTSPDDASYTGDDYTKYPPSQQAKFLNSFNFCGSQKPAVLIHKGPACAGPMSFYTKITVLPDSR